MTLKLNKFMTKEAIAEKLHSAPFRPIANRLTGDSSLPKQAPDFASGVLIMEVEMAENF